MPKSRTFSRRIRRHNRRRQSGGKRKRARRTRRSNRRPKIIYIQQAPEQQPQPTQQPQQGVFTWGDAGKLFAVDVGAIAVEKGVDELME